MKFLQIILLVVGIVGLAEGFSTAAPEKKVDKAAIRKQIDGLTSSNFDSTLKDIEGYLTKDAGVSFYAKSMRRITTKAKALKVSVPADYAKDAKATEKRREKQKAFIEAKQAAAAEAAAEAADAAAAEAESAADEGDAPEGEEAPAEE